MKKRYFITILCFLLSLLWVGYLYNQLAGFDQRNIYSDFAFNSSWETAPLSAETQEEVNTILSQDFFYLGKGCQVYAFVSADKRYILKLFKCQHLNKRLVEYLPSLPPFSNYQETVKNRRLLKANQLFSGYKLAFDTLPQETGILFIHFNKATPVEQPVVIHNRLGIKHSIDLGTIPFVLQKRVNSLYSAIETHMNNGDVDKVQALLAALIEVMKKRHKQGIKDIDYQLVFNVGVLDDEIIMFDPGQFVRDDSIKNDEESDKDIDRRFRELNLWLAKKYPDYPALQARLQKN